MLLIIVISFLFGFGCASVIWSPRFYDRALVESGNQSMKYIQNNKTTKHKIAIKTVGLTNNYSLCSIIKNTGCTLRISIDRQIKDRYLTDKENLNFIPISPSSNWDKSMLYIFNKSFNRDYIFPFKIDQGHSYELFLLK